MRRTLLLLTLLTSPLLAQDWPHFLGPANAPVSTEKFPDSFPDSGPKELWRINTGKGFSTPLIVNHKLYLNTLSGKDETLVCLDPATGKQIWTSTAGAGWSANGNMSYPGTRSTPTIDGDFIYTYSGHGDLVCRNLADGTVVWTTSVLKDTKAKDLVWGSASSPYIVGDSIFVQGGQDGPIAVAIDKKTGKYLWQAETGIASYATCVLAKIDNIDQLIVVAGKATFALDPATGKTLWSHPWETYYQINAANPVIKDDKIVLTGAYAHGSIMIQATANSAKVVWEKKNSIQAKFPTPILDPDGTLIGNSEGTITAIDFATGDSLWHDKEKIGPGGALLRLPDNKLLALSERGKLILYKADRKAITKISSFAAVDGQTVWSSPVISDGKLFVKGAEELACFDVTTK